jgi:hypothetical protein
MRRIARRKIAFVALAALVALGSTIGDVFAQTPQPGAPAAAPAPAVTKGGKVASPSKRMPRHTARHHRRRHAASPKCFAHEWRAFPVRDPRGYFYTPPGGGIC